MHHIAIALAACPELLALLGLDKLDDERAAEDFRPTQPAWFQLPLDLEASDE